MKAIEQYFHVVLFIMLHMVVLACKQADKTQVCAVTTQMKAIEQCFLVAHMIMPLYQVTLTLKSLKACGHLNESF